MLKRNLRVRRRHDFDLVYRHGRRVQVTGLQLRSHPNRLGKTRLAVVVSTKISKKATVRNRLRRQLLGVVASLHSQLTSGFDVVISVQQDISDWPPSQLARALIEGLSRLGLLGKTPA